MKPFEKNVHRWVLRGPFSGKRRQNQTLFLTPIIWNKSLCVYTGNKATLVAQPILQKTLNILPPHTNHHIVSCLSFNCRYGLYNNNTSPHHTKENEKEWNSTDYSGYFYFSNLFSVQPLIFFISMSLCRMCFHSLVLDIIRPI